MEGLRKTMKTSIKTDSVSAEVPARKLRDTRLQLISCILPCSLDTVDLMVSFTGLQLCPITNLLIVSPVLSAIT